MSRSFNTQAKALIHIYIYISIILPPNTSSTSWPSQWGFTTAKCPSDRCGIEETLLQPLLSPLAISASAATSRSGTRRDGIFWKVPRKKRQILGKYDERFHSFRILSVVFWDFWHDIGARPDWKHTSFCLRRIEAMTTLDLHSALLYWLYRPGDHNGSAHSLTHSLTHSFKHSFRSRFPPFLAGMVMIAAGPSMKKSEVCANDSGNVMLAKEVQA